MKNKIENTIFEIYDENTGKSLLFMANSFEDAENMSSFINFEDYENGDTINISKETTLKP